MIVSGVWTLAVTLPADICADSFVAATVAENVPWLHSGVSSSGFRVASAATQLPPGRMVRVPFGLGYSAEEQEQLPLVAAKVIYYLRGGDQADDPVTEAADDVPAPAAGSA
jgi:hypothetical protein